MQFAWLKVMQLLFCSRRPVNDDLFNMWVFAQAEMQAAIVLCAEAASARHLLRLVMSIPVDLHLSANGAAVAACAFQLEFDPLIFRSDRVFVQQQRSLL